jgi:hypothetical protein
MDESTKNQSLADDKHLLHELSALAGQIQPDVHFRAGLEARLTAGQVGRSSRFTKPLRNAAAVAAIIALLLTATLTIPPLRAIAQEIIDSLFNRTDADQETVVLGPYGIFQLVPYFYITVDEAQAEVDFTILEPSWIPEGLALHDVAYSPEEQVVSLSYREPTENFTAMPITIYEAPLDNGWSSHSYLAIGASADITAVQIKRADGAITGEYVKGFWVTPPDMRSGSIETPFAVQWNANIPICRLRWQDAGLMFEIWSQTSGWQGDCPVSLDEMVAIAESME